jgi:acetyltransferase-like isoleucine patch superfamily enzyme
VIEALREFWRTRNREYRLKWNRSVSFGDCVVDRWERARELGFGEGTSIYDSALVLGDVKVGKNTWIGPGVVLDGTGGLEIGDYCSISSGVQLYSHNSVDWAISGGTAPHKKARTIVGSRCYIGPQTVVAMGIVIGDGSVVGANSLVLHSIPAGTKAFGTPCRIIGAV